MKAYQLPERHHSVLPVKAVPFAVEKLIPRLIQYEQTGKAPNWWFSGEMTPKDLVSAARYEIETLCVVIEELTDKLPKCSVCCGVGTVTERMGGCRDDNESVICHKCKGCFLNA